MTMIDSGTQATPAEIKQSVAELEDEAITIIREVAAECRNPVLLFSGGKDSAVLLHLAAKAFRPGSLPFPVMHVDTGHNFEEVITYRDMLVEQYGVKLIVASVQESIDSGRAVEETGPRPSRNRLQSVTLLDAIAEHKFDAAFGGGRRDEDKARAKEPERRWRIQLQAVVRRSARRGGLSRHRAPLQGCPLCAWRSSPVHASGLWPAPHGPKPAWHDRTLRLRPQG
mgnify:CR=1 FL=1